MPPTLLTLMNQILSPSSWLTTLFFKPLWVLHALTMAVPFMIRTRTSVSKPLVFNFFSALRTSPPPFPLPSGQKELKIGAAGFCWGGKYTILLAGDAPSSRVHGWTAPASASASAGGVEGQQVAGLGPGAVTQTLSPLINAAFTAHPSNVDVPREVPAVKIPLSVCIGDTDLAMPSKQIQYMKSTLEGLSKKEVDGVEHEVVVLPGAKHGFAIRMDPKETKQMEFAEIAERQAVGWFGRWFA
jgi:dienelactone hydrolase